jgi:hypothetical protein
MSLTQTMHRIVNLLMSDVAGIGLHKFTLNTVPFTKNNGMTRYVDKVAGKVVFYHDKVEQSVVLCVGKFQLTVDFRNGEGQTERFSIMHNDTIKKMTDLVGSNPSAQWGCKLIVNPSGNVEGMQMECGKFSLYMPLLSADQTSVTEDDIKKWKLLTRIEILRQFDKASSVYKPSDFSHIIMVLWFGWILFEDEDRVFKRAPHVLQYVFSSLSGDDKAQSVVVGYCVKKNIHIDAATASELSCR